RGALERDFSWKPAVDIFEDEEAVHVKAEVPGMKPEDIKVSVENNVLSISGERKLEHEDRKDGYHRVERFYGNFSRSFALNEEVDAENIDAHYDAGILSLKLMKRPAAKRRQIAVKGA
ncbi:MAG: Hsp20/alpha crystallin family protein, partial [Myxococcales bacterium]